MTPDVNVLLAASRADHPHHPVAREWLERATSTADRGGSLLVLPMVIAGFLRLATNPRTFREPTPPDAAVAFIDSLLAVPGVELAGLGREWPALKRLVHQHALAANDVPDAWIAAAPSCPRRPCPDPTRHLSGTWRSGRERRPTVQPIAARGGRR